MQVHKINKTIYNIKLIKLFYFCKKKKIKLNMTFKYLLL